jgi:two-component system sensor histidine kinase RpfC
LPLSGGELGREQGQASLRMIMAVAVALYLALASDFIIAWPLPVWALLSATILAYSTAFLLATLRAKTPWLLRRIGGNVMDITATTYIMAATGEIGVPIFAVYLWVTIGNGFRFGVPALMVSAVSSIIGFGIVISVSELWQQHLTFAGGVLFTLIVLPLYAAHLINMLNTARHRAEEASAAKSRFLARMSHELRTPLNGILGAADLLEGGRRFSSEERSLLQVVRDSVQVSLRQISNVLDFSKIEAGKLTIERTNLDLHEVVNAAAAMARPVAKEKGLRFLVRMTPETPYRLIGDPHHLRAILLNLLSNAVKFTERGLVCLEIAAREVTKDSITVRIEVHDTGIGIAPEALGQIFESFTQEDVSTTRRHGGTGLGTTIAKQLVELMGGRIGVQSTKGEGSMFWCEIPFDRQPQDTDEREALAGCRAVLLSENSGIAEHYSRIFESFPGQLLRLSSSDATVDALARAIRLGNPVHAIFVDIMLAVGRDGRHRYEELSSKAESANVPLILVSHGSPPPEQLREWGYSAVLAPAAEEKLIRSVLRTSTIRIGEAAGGVVNVAPWIWGRSEGARPKILVVDDNRTNLMIVRRMIERAGYEVELAETGDRALERLCAGGFRLAVLDMHMPGLDGATVLRRYRQMRPRSRLPVIVLTANASLEAQRECADAGADAFLSKPVTAADLLAEVARFVQETKIEVLATSASSVARANDRNATASHAVLDFSVLAELDRLYHNPVEMAQVIDEYEREGVELLGKIEHACKTRDHAAFCENAHALKGNAANVGAMHLINVCHQAEAGGLVAFLRERDGLLTNMQQAFAETLTALSELLKPSVFHGDGTDHTTGKI